MKLEKDMIQEDWEREFYKDHMFLVEHQMEVDQQYQQWVEEQENKYRSPAKIRIVKKYKLQRK